MLSDVDKSMAYFHLLFRSIEKEISFDFGTESEFSYLYNQCYEMNTNEYVNAMTIRNNPVCVSVLFTFSLVKDLVDLFFTGMSTSYVHLTECPRNQNMVDQKLAWGKRTSGVVRKFLAASVHV